MGGHGGRPTVEAKPQAAKTFNKQNPKPRPLTALIGLCGKSNILGAIAACLLPWESTGDADSNA